MRIGAIVLAAGEGRRFGGNKLLVRVGGEPVILRVLRALSGFERVVVVGAYASELMPPHLSNEVVIYNPHYKDGMSTSIRLGLRFFQDYDAVLIVLADMPPNNQRGGIKDSECVPRWMQCRCANAQWRQGESSADS
ncbi:NTP transferase domain-containing protein [Vulcanisaeta distributa]|uniref:nucleotidyltransferase family protein n=1 Tax=Vulcanisaeta distributa TaxID=164451 RepID=UPI001FB444AA|nr:NTP transferase domain-containing protein [Vulcanisaeta distributa]